MCAALMKLEQVGTEQYVLSSALSSSSPSSSFARTSSGNIDLNRSTSGNAA
jgi:hypothetical protein